MDEDTQNRWLAFGAVVMLIWLLIGFGMMLGYFLWGESCG